MEAVYLAERERLNRRAWLDRDSVSIGFVVGAFLTAEAPLTVQLVYLVAAAGWLAYLWRNPRP